MKKRPLGKSGIEVSPIGLGCWQFSQGKGLVGKAWPGLPHETMDAIVRTALDGGIDWFDTADVYWGGKSEEALAGALSRAKVDLGSVSIATKWWPALRSSASLTGTFPERQARLAPYPVDLHQIHQPFSFSSAEKQALVLATLLRARSVRAVGVSNFNARMMQRVARVLAEEGCVLASNQVHYNLLDRRIETNGTMEAAREAGISIIAYSPLAQGLLTGRFHADATAAGKVSVMRRSFSGIDGRGIEGSRALISLMGEIATRHECSIAQVALAALLSFHGEMVLAIPGATKPRQAEEAALAMKLELGAAELEVIKVESWKAARR